MSQRAFLTLGNAFHTLGNGRFDPDRHEISRKVGQSMPCEPCNGTDLPVPHPAKGLLTTDYGAQEPRSKDKEICLSGKKGRTQMEESKVVNEIAESHLQSSGNSQKNINRWHLKAPFDLAQVNRIEINFLGQLFLGKARKLPIFPDAIAQQLSISWSNHCCTLSKQADSKAHRFQ